MNRLPTDLARASWARAEKGGITAARRAVSAFIKDESGATALEYGLIAGLVFLAILSNVSAIGEDVGAAFSGVSSDLQDAAAGNMN